LTNAIKLIKLIYPSCSAARTNVHRFRVLFILPTSSTVIILTVLVLVLVFVIRETLIETEGATTCRL